MYLSAFAYLTLNANTLFSNLFLVEASVKQNQQQVAAPGGDTSTLMPSNWSNTSKIQQNLP